MISHNNPVPYYYMNYLLTGLTMFCDDDGDIDTQRWICGSHGQMNYQNATEKTSLMFGSFDLNIWAWLEVYEMELATCGENE